MHPHVAVHTSFRPADTHWDLRCPGLRWAGEMAVSKAGMVLTLEAAVPTLPPPPPQRKMTANK